MREAEKKQYDRQNAYNLEHYDRVGTVLPKGSRERLRQKAGELGLSVNAYIKKIILEALDEE